MKTPSFPEISYADWLDEVQSQLGDLDPSTILSQSWDGASFQALCTARHPEPGTEVAVLAGDSDQAPDGLSWIPCQSYDLADIEKLKNYLKSDLDNGIRGLRLRLDEAGQKGEDPFISDRVGIGGAPIYSRGDLEDALEGAGPTWEALLLDGGGSFLAFSAIFAGWLESHELPPDGSSVLLGADPLGTLAACGELPASFATLTEDLAALIRHSQAFRGSSRALAVNTAPYREAGAEIDLELAICLATATEYLRGLSEHGIEPERVAAEIAFLTITGQQVFPEIAKIRALRTLWSHLLGECGVSEPITPWIHASVLRRSLHQREPTNNLMRITASTWAAALGGADSLETPGYDEIVEEGASARGRRLARNTQLILGLESHLTRAGDPASGSYLLDHLTRDLTDRAWSSFQAIEEKGGLLQCLDSGWLQKAVEDRWDERRDRIKKGDIEITGVNAFADPDASVLRGEKDLDPSLVESIRDRYRTQLAVQEALGAHDYRAGENRWSWCLDAATADRPLFEIIRQIYAEESTLRVSALRPRRDSEPLENGASEA